MAFFWKFGGLPSQVVWGFQGSRRLGPRGGFTVKGMVLSAPRSLTKGWPPIPAHPARALLEPSSAQAALTAISRHGQRTASLLRALGRRVGSSDLRTMELKGFVLGFSAFDWFCGGFVMQRITLWFCVCASLPKRGGFTEGVLKGPRKKSRHHEKPAIGTSTVRERAAKGTFAGPSTGSDAQGGAISGTNRELGFVLWYICLRLREPHIALCPYN